MSGDNWLDAFDDSDFDDPELAALDGAVDKVMSGLAPSVQPAAQVQPANVPWRRIWLAAGVMLGAMGAGLYQSLNQSAVSEEVAASPAADGVLRTAQKAPGLLPHAGAEMVIADGHATLVAGLLTYVHDDAHDPGVRDVRWANLPVVALPLGTVFTAAAGTSAGALTVSESRVNLQHDSGASLALLDVDDEVAFVFDEASPHGVMVLNTRGLPLDQVKALVPAACECAADVVKTVATLRFSAMPSLSTLPESKE